MIVLLQRVLSAEVYVGGVCRAHIGSGLLAFVAFERGDDPSCVAPTLARVMRYRVFADDSGRMAQSLHDVGGALLLVPQFTLAADTRRGSRPDFGPALDAAGGRRLWEHCVQEAARLLPGTCAGLFGADMQVALVNDGPVTFWIQSPRRSD
ncbi:MAG TPA: D-aminoacyl-tRNA deacylase [Acidiferrobacteraceae bacterium]|nr:D-aminoacyl-tRNA deacylase [Acidiferrobacteraceae bacterium]